jgi:hypothetical protein
VGDVVVKAVLAVLCFVPSVALGQSWRGLLSPGPVGEDHVPAEPSCDKCHLVFEGVPNEKCLRCHADLRGFHASVRKDPCISCHDDHLGRDGAMTRKEALSAFDHARTGFALEGAHAGVKCAECHTGPIGKMAAKCGGCHEDVHEAKLGDDCAKCHSNTKWKGDVKTREAHQVAMTGGHAEAQCSDCHAKGAHLEEKVACASCHERAHGGTEEACHNCHSVAGWKPAKFDHSFCTCRFPGKHKTVSCLSCHAEFRFTSTPTLCSGCHEKERKHDPLGECSLCHSALSWKDNTFDHNERSKFALTGSHLEVDCNRCHKELKGTKVQFREAPEDCKGCHAEDGQEAHGDFGACEKCHTTEAFEKPTFDHASTGFPITGKHAELGCQKCHAEKVRGFGKPRAEIRSEGREVLLASVGWTAVLASQHAAESKATQCGHCHEDPHRGTAGGKGCETCHSTDAWAPSTFDRTRHEATKLPLLGKHQTTECRLCHVGSALTGLPAECAGCHTDRHEGRLGDRCKDCHTEDGFKPVPDFDHAKTSFALAGFHARAACEKCHEGPIADAMRKHRSDPAKPPLTCEPCHPPGHADFGACARCHGESTPFAEARAAFDHRDTAFALERKHAAIPCKACHVPDRPPPMARCETCHFEPHAGQLTASCDGCHRPDRWTIVRYDHDRAGWPLRGRHFVTSCERCHTSERWIGVTTECWDCHALDAARGAAAAPGAHPFGRIDCADCHFSGFTWRM